MRHVAQSQRERDCGRLVCVETHPEIRVRREGEERRASFAGLLRCGHVWTCAPCSQRIRARQAARISDAISWLGGTWAMVTLTLRHNAGMPLHALLRCTKHCWRRMRQRRDLRDLWKAVAIAPITATEITHGENGWHPHLHIIFKVGRELRSEERALFLQRWQEAIVAELGAAARPNDERGIVWSTSFDAAKEGERALYVSKLGLALEVSDAGMAKLSARSPFEIARAAGLGDQKALEKWREFYKATKGLHVLQLSPDAADAADAAKKDKMLEALEHADPTDRFEPENIIVPTSVVGAMRRAEHRWPTVFHALLVAAERGGSHGAWRWMAEHFPSALLVSSELHRLVIPVQHWPP